MDGKYNVKVLESNRELSKREAVKFTDYAQYQSLPEILKVSPDFSFQPHTYVVLGVHNECIKDSDVKDYEVYLFEDAEGNVFYTGSSSFFDSYMTIVTVMEGEPDYFVGICQKQSNNHQGKFYKAILL